MATWQVQQAKNRLSEVIERATDQGPQIITRHGTETAVLLSFSDYQRLTAPKEKLTTFLRNSPLVGVDLDLSRDRGTARPVPEL